MFLFSKVPVVDIFFLIWHLSPSAKGLCNRLVIHGIRGQTDSLQIRVNYINSPLIYWAHHNLSLSSLHYFWKLILQGWFRFAILRKSNWIKNRPPNIFFSWEITIASSAVRSNAAIAIRFIKIYSNVVDCIRKQAAIAIYLGCKAELWWWCHYPIPHILGSDDYIFPLSTAYRNQQLQYFKSFSSCRPYQFSISQQ